MKKLLNKLLIVIILVVLLFNFVCIPQSKAATFGGILIKPFSLFGLVILDTIAFSVTALVGVMSNGLIDWMADWNQDAMDVLEDSWCNEDMRNSIESPLETAIEISGMGFLTMEDFFRGKLEISDINIFNSMPSGNGIENILDTTDNNENSIINAVKISVASWYYGLRNIAAVGLLCVLIYIAIRILLSTIAEDKAHYKDLLTDWIKAACLVIFAHVLIMIILNIGDYIGEIFVGMTKRYSSIAWVRAKLITEWNATQIMYLIMYGMLIYYTIAFTISYMKRFLYTMLLIIIAPIVALVYAFGKEGKNIFNKWLKEFILNAFLQPYHLLIYTVLFGFVAAIASESNDFNSIYITLYSLIVLHFIKDAEKYYRALFGMNAGVAGIGQFDTGAKTIERVVHKTKEIAKTALSIGTLAIPGGAILGSAANATQGAQAVNAANTAQNMGDIANGFGGDDSTGPITGELPGPIGGPDDDPIGGPDDDPTGGPDVPGGGNTFDIPDSDDLSNGQDSNDTGNSDGKDFGNTRGRNLEVDTITSQNLESGQADINDLELRQANIGDLKANQHNSTGPIEEQTGRDEKTGRVEKTRTVIGGAVDTVFGGKLGSTVAETMNKSNEIYQSRVAMGESPKEARKNAAMLGLDAVINGKEGDITGDVYTKAQSTENMGRYREGITDTLTSNVNSSTTVNIDSKDNSTKKLKAHQETIIQSTSVQSGNVNISKGPSEVAMKKMIKETMKEMPGMNKLPSNIADQIAGNVAEELEKNGMNNIDMNDFERTVKDVMSKMTSSTMTIEKTTKVENVEKFTNLNITEGSSGIEDRKSLKN